MNAQYIPIGTKFIGFFTMFMVMTLDAESGKDLLDVVVAYLDAKTQVLNSGGR